MPRNKPEEDGSPQKAVAAALHALWSAPTKFPSVRDLARVMERDRIPGQIGHTTINGVLSGGQQAEQLSHVLAVARAVVALDPGIESADRDHRVARVGALYHALFSAPPDIPPVKATPTPAPQIVNHCANVAFDWGSARPGPSNGAYEVHATLALPISSPSYLRSELLDIDRATIMQYAVLEGSSARYLGNGGWDTLRDDGPTWHALWGPVGKENEYSLHIFLDAIGAITVFIGVAETYGDVGVIAMAATETAIEIAVRYEWRGDVDILCRACGPVYGQTRNPDYDREPNGWQTLANARFPLPDPRESARPLASAILFPQPDDDRTRWQLEEVGRRMRDARLGRWTPDDPLERFDFDDVED